MDARNALFAATREAQTLGVQGHDLSQRRGSLVPHVEVTIAVNLCMPCASRPSSAARAGGSGQPRAAPPVTTPVLVVDLGMHGPNPAINPPVRRVLLT